MSRQDENETQSVDIPFPPYIPPKLTEEELRWQQEDEEREHLQAYADSLNYQKPIFDPFIVFNPSIGFIETKIKELKQEAGNWLRIKREWGFSPQDEVPSMDEPHQKLISRINQYEYRVKQRRRFGNWESNSRKGEITQEDIQLAKQYPIIDLYTGRGRSSSKRTMGPCPFHQDDTASFMIYKEQNSWWCYGACGIGGDVIDFVMKRDNIKFIDAVKLLLNK